MITKKSRTSKAPLLLKLYFFRLTKVKGIEVRHFKKVFQENASEEEYYGIFCGEKI